MAVVGFGLLSVPSAVGQDLSPFDPTGLLLGDPEVYSVEVHNHALAGFSVEVDVGPGWGAFGGAGLCYFSSRPFPRCCLSYNGLNSPVIRWPAPLYLAYPPSGTSTYSYDFKLVPKLTDGRIEGRYFISLGMEVNLTLYIEVTNGYVSNIYSYVDSTWCPPLIYQSRRYNDGWFRN